MNQAPAAQSVDKTLQGRVLGAVISQNNGQLGGSLSIRLRGTGSIMGGAEPLIERRTDFVPEGEQTQGAITTLIFTPTTFNPAYSPTLGRYPYSPVLGDVPADAAVGMPVEP